MLYIQTYVHVRTDVYCCVEENFLYIYSYNIVIVPAHIANSIIICDHAYILCISVMSMQVRIIKCDMHVWDLIKQRANFMYI